MPVCDTCQLRNEPGRLFCTQCGARLDLSHVSDEDFREPRVTLKSLLARIPYRIVIPLLVVVVLVALVMTPKREPLGAAPSRDGARRVSEALKILYEAQDVERLGRDFTEQDINAYCREIRVPELELESLSVQLLPGSIRLRMLTVAFRLPGGKPVRMSREVTLEPTGAGVKVTGGQVGQLPLPGFLRGVAVGPIRARFQDEREMLVFKRIQHLASDEGRLVIEVGR